MSTFDIQVIPEEPIVLLTAHASYRFNDHLVDSIYALQDVLERQGDLVFLILDFTEYDNPEYQEVLDSSVVMAVGDQAILHHSSIHEVIAITDHSLMQLALEGLTAKSFGNVKIQVFDTLDKGLSYARS